MVQAAVKAVSDKLGNTGRILVRESGTEPLIRVMVEAESEETCRAYVYHWGLTLGKSAKMNGSDLRGFFAFSVDKVPGGDCLKTQII